MANWTDDIQALTSFTPYVQQQPIEAMVSVGTTKQQQYNEGIQKLQSYIDNIAGLDVVRDVDKRYLQSKLNQLGDKLKLVAGGDFSNFQLVNSTAGMINQIAKDNNIINAVSNTQKYKEQLNLLNSAKKEGKSAIQNEWDFQTNANKWLLSEDLNESFNASYTPYIDVDKKFIEVLKNLHPDLLEQDIPYERNADGTLNYEKTAAAMQRISKESVSAAKIEGALRASLSPEEINQLGINGRFQFRGADADQLIQYHSASTVSQIEKNNKIIAELEGVIKLSSSDPSMVNNARKSIDEYKAYNAQLQSRLNEDILSIRNNPEAAKEYIYKNEAIRQFAVNHSWETNKTNLLTNPVLEAEHWERNYALNQSKFMLDRAQFAWSQYKDKFDMDMANKEYELKVKKQFTDLYGSESNFTVYGGLSTTLVKEPSVAMRDDIVSLNREADTQVQSLAKKAGVSVGQIEKALSDYNSGNANGRDALKIIPIRFREEAQQIINKRNKATRLQDALTRIEEEVKNSPEFRNIELQIQQKLNSSEYQTLSISDNGDVLNFSKSELLELATKIVPDISDAGPITGVSLFSPGLSLNKYRNTDKELKFVEYYKTADPKTKMLINRILDKYKLVNLEYTEYLNKVNESVNKRVSESHGEYVPMEIPIIFSSEGGDIARRNWEGITGAVLDRYKGDILGQRGGAEKLSKSDIQKVQKWISSEGKQHIQYLKLIQGDKQSLIVRKEGEEVIIPLTDIEARNLPLSSTSEPSYEYKEVYKAQRYGNGDTNPSGKFEKAYYTRTYFPNVQKFNIKADLAENSTNSALNYLTLRLMLPNSGQVDLQIEKSLNRDQIPAYLGGLTDDKIKSLFLSDPNISIEQKKEIKNF